MKKIFAVLAGLLTYSAVYALPVYNPDQPELLKYGVFTCGDSCWGIEFGYRGDFVFDRKLKRKNTGSVVDGNRRAPNYASSTNAGQLTLNLWDRLDVYGWCGATQTEFEFVADYVGTVTTSPFYDIRGVTKEDFSWGVGARAVLWQCGRTAVGVDGQYSQRRANLHSLTFNGQPVQSFFTTLIDPDRFSLKNREWQVSLGISHRICWLVPYVAVKYSNVRARFHGPDVIPSTVIGTINPRLCYRNKDYVGFVAGVSLVDSERMHVTAEGRWIDERALTIAADIRF